MYIVCQREMEDQRIFSLAPISKCSIFKAFITEIWLSNSNISNILEECPNCLFLFQEKCLQTTIPPCYLYLVTVPNVRKTCSLFQWTICDSQNLVKNIQRRWVRPWKCLFLYNYSFKNRKGPTPKPSFPLFTHFWGLIAPGKNFAARLQESNQLKQPHRIKLVFLSSAAESLGTDQNLRYGTIFL